MEWPSSSLTGRVMIHGSGRIAVLVVALAMLLRLSRTSLSRQAPSSLRQAPNLDPMTHLNTRLATHALAKTMITAIHRTALPQAIADGPGLTVSLTMALMLPVVVTLEIECFDQLYRQILAYHSIYFYKSICRSSRFDFHPTYHLYFSLQSSIHP